VTVCRLYLVINLYLKKTFIMKRIFYLNLFAFIFLSASAPNDSTRQVSPKHKIWVYGSDGSVTQGILISTTDSSLKIFPGKFGEWNKHSKNSVIDQSCLNISKIETHKKNGLIRGTLIGAGIGLSPGHIKLNIW
jgi:hypothetical protein